MSPFKLALLRLNACNAAGLETTQFSSETRPLDPADLDGQSVSFDFEVDGNRVKGEGVFQVTEVPAGVYISILVIEQDCGATRCLELYQPEANEIVKSAQSVGFICHVRSATSA